MESIAAAVSYHRAKKVRALLISHFIETLCLRTIAKDDHPHHATITVVVHETNGVFAIGIFRITRCQNYSVGADQAIGSNYIVARGPSGTGEWKQCDNQCKPKHDLSPCILDQAFVSHGKRFKMAKTALMRKHKSGDGPRLPKRGAAAIRQLSGVHRPRR